MKDDGYYRGRVKAWDFNNDTRKGTFQLVLTCIFAEYAEELSDDFKEITDDDNKPKPIKRNISIYFSPDRLDMAKRELKSLGFDKPLKAEYLQPGNENSYDFSAHEIISVVSHNEREDPKTHKAKEYENWNICTRRKAKPLSIEAASAFDSMMESSGDEEEGNGPPF